MSLAKKYPDRSMDLHAPGLSELSVKLWWEGGENIDSSPASPQKDLNFPYRKIFFFLFVFSLSTVNSYFLNFFVKSFLLSFFFYWVLESKFAFYLIKTL